MISESHSFRLISLSEGSSPSSGSAVRAVHLRRSIISSAGRPESGGSTVRFKHSYMEIVWSAGKSESGDTSVSAVLPVLIVCSAGRSESGGNVKHSSTKACDLKRSIGAPGRFGSTLVA